MKGTMEQALMVNMQGDKGGASVTSKTSFCLGAYDQPHAISKGMIVRRLTPVECERLMGMPDNYTQIPWRGKPKEDCPDGPRYKAIGNSIAVPCLGWIGERMKR